MKDKFIRVISPITAAVVALLDIAVIIYGVFAVTKLMEQKTASVIFFAAIEVFAIIVAVLVTKEVVKNGVIFRDDEFEFTGLDENNIFEYDNIEKIETFKDDAPSLVKNFVDRHAVITLTLKEDKVVSIDIGLCTKYTLEFIAKEIGERSHVEYIPPKPQPNFTFKHKKDTQTEELPKEETSKDETSKDENLSDKDKEEQLPKDE